MPSTCTHHRRRAHAEHLRARAPMPGARPQPQSRGDDADPPPLPGLPPTFGRPVTAPALPLHIGVSGTLITF